MLHGLTISEQPFKEIVLVFGTTFVANVAKAIFMVVVINPTETNIQKFGILEVLRLVRYGLLAFSKVIPYLVELT